MEVPWIAVNQHLDWLIRSVRTVSLSVLDFYVGDRVKEVWCSPPQHSAACGEALAANVQVNGICWIYKHGVDSRHSVAQLSCLLQKACSRSYNRITALTARCRCWYSRASALLQRWNCSICRYDSSRSGTVRSHRDAKGVVATLISVVPGSASCRMCMRYNMSTPEHRSQGPLLHMQQSAELQHIIQTRFHLFEAFKSCVAAADGLLTGGNLRVKHRQAACSRGPTGLLCSSSLLLLCQQPILLMLRVCRWGSSQHGSMLAHMECPHA